MKLRITRLAILLIVICNVGCDQISKNIVRKEVGYYENIKVFTDNITLTKVENTGAFLSVGSILPQFLKFALLIILPAIVLSTGLYFILTKVRLSRLTIIGAAFVIGGGIGNLYDRIMFGSVTDFLHIDFIVFQTGVFNFADVSIMIGMGMIIAAAYAKRRIMAADH
ncbi:signal peptidase II [Pedobacter sp. JCM 36344]|uniref:signal peptidase II n=1 Tax=Pedobacter sp. JCM 36344 TaxID=3374280 RepID=UPI00397A7817